MLLIVDVGSSHGRLGLYRPRVGYPNIVLVQGPVQASWLNQIEIHLSIIQRNVFTPNDLSSVEEVQDRLLRCEGC